MCSVRPGHTYQLAEFIDLQVDICSFFTTTMSVRHIMLIISCSTILEQLSLAAWMASCELTKKVCYTAQAAVREQQAKVGLNAVVATAEQVHWQCSLVQPPHETFIRSCCPDSRYFPYASGLIHGVILRSGVMFCSCWPTCALGCGSMLQLAAPLSAALLTLMTPQASRCPSLVRHRAPWWPSRQRSSTAQSEQTISCIVPSCAGHPLLVPCSRCLCAKSA